MRRLIASRRAPLVLLAAPTGYGKTCLLSEWSDVDERPFAWLTLEENDNNAEQLIARIAQAIGRAGAAPEGRVRRLRSSYEGLGVPAVVRMLETQVQPLVLVLDDMHVLDSRDALNVVRALISHLRPGCQLAISSRVQPALRLGRLRARHQLTEMHAADLTMNHAEAAMLLGGAGLSLDPEHMAMLLRRTEGWPAALYLSALSLREEPDVLALVDGFAGDDGILSDYLREELIGQVSEDAATFLRRTSILDQLSSPLCDDVLERSGSARVLFELAHRHLLLTPLERTDERYRCHGLLREMLLRELRRDDPLEVLELQRRASSWYSAHGDPDRAVAHAVRAADVHRVGTLLWSNLPRYMDRGRGEIVLDWLAAFTDEQLATDAALSLFAAHRHLNSGDLPQAEYWKAAANVALEHQEQPPEVDSLRAGIVLIDAVLARHGIARMGADAARAFELAPEHSSWRAACRLHEGVAAYLAADPVRARELLDDGVHRSAKIPGVEALCQAHLAIIAVGEDEWELAEDHSRAATGLIERHELAGSPAATLVFAVGALVCAQLGHADGAKDLLRKASVLLRSSDRYAPWYAELTRMMLGRAAARLTDVHRARTLLAEASRAGRRVSDAPVLDQWLDEALGELDAGAATALEGSSLLTLAELRILRFLPTHLSFREIGDRLHVSTNTVKSQAHAVYRKLDASSRSEAVARASRAGLIWTTTSTDT